MSGLSSSYISPLALALNASAGFVSLVISLPEFFGSLLQLFSVGLVNRYSRKKILFISVIIESFIWLPIAVLPFISTNRLLMLLILVALQFGLRYLQEPIYNSILGEIVAPNLRGAFFAKRQKNVGILNSLGTFIAGMILSTFSNVNRFLGFGIIFLLSFILRLWSCRYIAHFHVQKQKKPAGIPFYSFIKNLDQDIFGQFVIFLSLFKLCAAIASPFFVVYMLQSLRLDYLSFTLVTISSIIARFLFMDFWGSSIDNAGSKKIMILSGFLIPFIPIAWIFFKEVIFLIILQFISGFLWAGFDLSTSSYFFDSTLSRDRIRLNSYLNIIKSFGTFCGAMLGILLLNIPFKLYENKLLFLFLASGLLRIIVIFFFGLRIKESRLIEVKINRTNKTCINIAPSQEVLFELVDRNGRIKTSSYRRS